MAIHPLNRYQRVYDRLEFKECPVFKSQQGKDATDL
jgi:hypothetical protein